MVAEFTDNEDLIDLIAFGLSGFDALEISHDAFDVRKINGVRLD